MDGWMHGCMDACMHVCMYVHRYEYDTYLHEWKEHHSLHTD